MKQSTLLAGLILALEAIGMGGGPAWAGPQIGAYGVTSTQVVMDEQGANVLDFLTAVRQANRSGFIKFELKREDRQPFRIGLTLRKGAHKFTGQVVLVTHDAYDSDFQSNHTMEVRYDTVAACKRTLAAFLSMRSSQVSFRGVCRKQAAGAELRLDVIPLVPVNQALYR